MEIFPNSLCILLKRMTFRTKHDWMFIWDPFDFYVALLINELFRHVLISFCDTLSAHCPMSGAALGATGDVKLNETAPSSVGARDQMGADT